MKTPKTYADLMRAMIEILGDCYIGEDNDGQLIVFTGLKEDKRQCLSRIDDDEE